MGNQSAHERQLEGSYRITTQLFDVQHSPKCCSIIIPEGVIHPMIDAAALQDLLEMSTYVKCHVLKVRPISLVDLDGYLIEVIVIFNL